MCIALWSLDHPDYALILGANRDEYLSRPTVNAQFHSFGQDPEDGFVLSGRDLQAGGSWLGINRAGRVALLTNISEDSASYEQSRGHLVSSFLLERAPDAEQFGGRLSDIGSSEFAGFSLLLLSPLGGGVTGVLTYEAALITNSEGGGAITHRTVRAEERRIGGISNGVDGMDGNDWPKVKKGEACLAEVLYDDQMEPRPLSSDDLVESIFGILSLHSEPPPANRFQLHTSIQISPLYMSGSLSPNAEPADGDKLYGTRLSTVLLVRRDGRVLFIERDVWKLDSTGNAVQGASRGVRALHFVLGSFKEDGDDHRGKNLHKAGQF